MSNPDPWDSFQHWFIHRWWQKSNINNQKSILLFTDVSKRKIYYFWYVAIFKPNVLHGGVMYLYVVTIAQTIHSKSHHLLENLLRSLFTVLGLPTSNI